jgi:carbonic anhydrase
MSSDKLSAKIVGSDSGSSLLSDLRSGLVVFLVALPLCLGIAMASGDGVPLIAGILSGIIGGLLVGALSGSHTSVSGPAAGLTAVVATQLDQLGSFEIFLMAVFIGGIIQVGLGLAKAGSLSSFFPSSVIKGLLAAIGVILVMKQIPHLVGDDKDFEGEMAFFQPDERNTFTELAAVFQGEWHLGAMIVGFFSIAVLLLWQRVSYLKRSFLPGPLVVVVAGVVINMLFKYFEGPLIEAQHLVELPVVKGASIVKAFLRHPDFSQWLNPEVYAAGVTIAVVASLESLLNLQAVDKLDPQGRVSPPSRELMAQGAGNIVAGLIGALPVTSVVVRGSVNVSSGSRTKLSAIFHGLLLLVCVAFLPQYLNKIPLASLAAILLVTGAKLASPALFRQMASEGLYQFAPFIMTLLSIVFTDLLTGILVGLSVSVLFILNSNLRRPVRQILETHLSGEVLVIELPNQVSFLNRAALNRALEEVAAGTHLVIDASETDYLDPDVLSLIRDFKANRGPIRGIEVSLRGFRNKYNLTNEIRFADYSTRELQDRLEPTQALDILKEGNRRFTTGKRLTHDFNRQVNGTALGQNPFAAVLSCIDSRVPAELVLDLGIGDIFSVRVAGNVPGSTTLGSLEYAVAVSGVKLVLVMGHTRCGAISSTIELLSTGKTVKEATGCDHLHSIVDHIDPCLDKDRCVLLDTLSQQQSDELINDVAKKNVHRTSQMIIDKSAVIRTAVESETVMVVGALYDVTTGNIEFFEGGIDA